MLTQGLEIKAKLLQSLVAYARLMGASGLHPSTHSRCSLAELGAP